MRRLYLMREVDQAAFTTAHRDGATVIDVREPFEYLGGHVPGAALIPMGQLPSRLADLPRDVPVYVICASGNRSLAAAHHVNADDPVTFDRVAVRDGDLIPVGDTMRVRVRATPGHTFTHLSYLLDAGGREVGAFTGGSLLYGSVGRPDLLGPGHTETLVHHQYASADCLAAELPDTAAVYPTHGFGSFCSATQSEVSASTIGQEKRTNPALTQPEREFVADVLAGLDAWPAYYAHMVPANTAGPAIPDLSPPQRADAEDRKSTRLNSS